MNPVTGPQIGTPAGTRGADEGCEIDHLNPRMRLGRVAQDAADTLHPLHVVGRVDPAGLIGRPGREHDDRTSRERVEQIEPGLDIGLIPRMELCATRPPPGVVELTIDHNPLPGHDYGYRCFVAVEPESSRSE